MRAQWLVPAGIALNTVALFLNVDGGPHGVRLVVKSVLQVAALCCWTVAMVGLWRARQRRLQAAAEDQEVGTADA